LHQFEIDRQRVLEQDLTGLRHITGNSFTAESDAVLSEINTFLNRYDTKTLATPTLTLGLYNLLRERLLKLSESSVRQYDQLTENRVVNAKIERFLDLETEICESPEVNANARPSQEVNATPSPGLNNYAYDDIAEATDHERDA
jgi:hypothetical protein